jgi:predicted MFS family arabinose efflux permease
VLRYQPAHTAVAGAFLLTGLVFGTWTARVPALQAGIDLTDGELALALVALNGGAVAGLQAGPTLISRFGSRATLRVALPAFALLLPPIAAAPTAPALACALAASGAVNSVVDVAINANGVTVERRYRHVVLSRLHAMLTLGGIIGAGIGALAAHLGVGVTVHFTAAAAVGTGGALLLSRWLTTDGPVRPTRQPRPPGHTTWLLGLGGLAFCVTLAEGSGNDWTAVYLHDLGATDTFAASGVAVFLGAMTAGRLAGDHIRGRIDPIPLVRGAALVAALGFGLTLLFRHPIAGVAGFGLLGLGLSVTLPVILGVASHRAVETGQSPAATVARVSTMAYLGSFAGPALIGVMATTTELRTALFVSVAASGAAALGAGILAKHPSPTATLVQPRPPTSKTS